VKRIALYYPWIYLRGGAERVILEIARRSRHRWTVFANWVDFDQTFPEFRALPNLVVLDPVPVQRSFAAVLRAAATVARQRLPLEDHEALLVISEGLGDFVTFRNHDRPVACFCLTPARPVFDPVYRRAWLARHPAARLPLHFFSAGYAWLTRRAWRHYERVFADSGEVQARIVAGGLRPAGQVEVLHPGVDVAAIRPTFGHEPYFLYAGRIKWTKNVELAIDAFRAFRAASTDSRAWRLVIAGGVDAASREYAADLQRRAGLDGGVSFVMNPSDAELDALYARCCALVFPSLNEDWGIVPLEAMAHGKPVLAVNRGGPTESVIDGETGFLLEPTAAAFAARLDWLVSHPGDVERLGRAAASRGAAYSWDGFVGRLDDYFESRD
jgi:glycosyltransferase involved in cell wall biosynthesis